jgi:hypothetical protein
MLGLPARGPMPRQTAPRNGDPRLVATGVVEGVLSPG